MPSEDLRIRFSVESRYAKRQHDANLPDCFIPIFLPVRSLLRQTENQAGREYVTGRWIKRIDKIKISVMRRRPDLLLRR